MEYLALNEEIFWKVIKYNTYDALSKPDLTFQEKMALIWARDEKTRKNIMCSLPIWLKMLSQSPKLL